MKRRRELAERVLWRCAAGLSIAAIVCGIASVLFGGRGDVVVSGSLIVAAVALGIAVYVSIVVMGFMGVRRLQKRDHPIA